MATLKESLKGKLSAKEIELVPTSFDTIGSIAIFSDMPNRLIKKERTIGNELMKLNSSIKTVAKKTKKHSGIYRIRKIAVIAGEKNKETLHKENGIAVNLNVETCYFSPRLSNERMRIAKLVRKNESVLVMFSGVGIYPLVIAKNSKAKEIYGIELNPKAHKYAVENIRLNKASNVIVIEGDARKESIKLKKKFDRIVMPLPASAEDFLDCALAAAKKNAIIHFYKFQAADELENAADEIMKKIKNIKVLRIIKCGEYASRIYRICIDFKVI